MKTNARLLANTQRYRKTKKGILTNCYNKMKNRRKVSFSLQEFQNKYIDDKTFNRLYLDWIEHNYNLQYKPTPDRIDCLKDYTFENLHWVTWSDNRYKQRLELRRIRARKIYMIIDNKIIKEFNSQREVVLKTGLSQSNLSSCLNGKRNFCGGYKWVYADKINPELLKGE